MEESVSNGSYGSAVVVGAVPVLARVDLGLQAAAPVVRQSSVPLPQGEELGDKELIQSEGEVGLLVWVAGIIWGALTGWATYEMTKAWGAAGAAVAGAIAAGGGLAIGAAASGPSRLQY